MVEYRADQYGESFADVYDDWYAHVSDVDATVRTVTAMARGPRVLELGVGTGRIALALARVGCEVVGIDASASMRGQRSVFARGLALTLIKKLLLQGEDVYFSFFD